MTPQCFCCHRPAIRFDRQIGQWVCEGNIDCAMTRKAEADSAPPERPVNALWNQYLLQVMKQFRGSQHPPTPMQIEMWKANFYAGACAAINFLFDIRLVDSPRVYQIIKAARKEIEREAEALIAEASRGFIQ